MKKSSYYCWMAILSLFPAVSHPLPVIQEIVSGDVVISSPDRESLILRTPDFSIIQYQNFSIGRGESVKFIQPTSSSVVLNRVGGGEVSSIWGSLASNGKVFLVNPNGVYFGPTAQVNVGSLITSTLDITNQDYLENRFNFKQTGSNGSIINQGVIQAEQDAILLSSKVINEGQIVALVGKVVMAAGEKITLSFAEDKMISFSMEGTDPSAEIINEGICTASKGEVFLSVNTVRKIIDAVVNFDEVLEGNTIVEEGGKIFLRGSSSLTANQVTLSGGTGSTLSAEGEIKADTKICLTFDHIALQSSFLQAPGGEISLNALHLEIDPTSTFSTSGLGSQDAGLISFYANDTLVLQGHLLARGGDVKGDGGIVKTYSKNTLEIGDVFVDTGITQGKIGTWFFNPSSLEELHPENIFSHLHISLQGGETIHTSIALQQKGVGLTLETTPADSFLYLGADLSTQAGKISVRSPLQLVGEDPIHITTSGADITFTEIVDSAFLAVDLILQAGKEGKIYFEQPVGHIHPLGKVQVDEAKAVYLSQNLVTNGKSVTLHAPLHLMGDSKIDTTAGGLTLEGADISLLQGTTGNHRLSLDAGFTGVITTKEGVGVKGAVLSSISMKGSAIHIEGDVKADGGTIIYNGPVYLSSDTTMIDTGPTGIIFLDTLNSVGLAHSLTLSAPVGKVLLLGEVGGQTSLKDVTVSSQRIEMKSDITLEGDLVVGGATYLLDDVSVRASNITFEKTIEGLHNFTLDVGSSGTILLKNHVGKKNRVGEFRIVNAGTVTTESIYANSILQQAGTDLTVFNGILDTVYQEGVELTGTSFTLRGGVRTRNGGSFTANQSDTLSILQAMDLSGSFYQSSMGNVELFADISTNGHNISFTGHVLLQGSSSLSTGEEGFGNISFFDEIDSLLSHPYSLDLTLGGGDLLFTDTVGATGPLGDIIVHTVRNVTALDSIRSLSYTQLQGSGIGSYSGSMTSTGDVGMYIFSNYLEFAGQEAGQLLKTLGNGNMMINALYGGLGSVNNPLAISVGLGRGTFYEGAFGDVYLASDVNQVANICAIRANPGCQVFYSVGGSSYGAVTPDFCCHTIPPVPPPPPPPPPHKKTHLPDPRLYYISGIYTNYWSYKDTLGSAWYYTSDFASRWWNVIDYPCKPSIEGIYGLDSGCMLAQIEVDLSTEATQEILQNVIAASSLETADLSPVLADFNNLTENTSYFWNKFLLFIGCFSIMSIISVAAREEYKRVFKVRKRRRRR